MKYFTIIFFLLAVWVISGHTNTKDGSRRVFPKSWDTAGVFKDKHVLAWVQFEDTVSRVDWCIVKKRNCLVMETGHDSSGGLTYTISNYIRYQGRNISEWESAFDFLAVMKGELISSIIPVGHTKTFDHQPDSTEVYSLLEEWGFTLYHEGHLTLAEGIDYRLWTLILGWKPDRARLMNEDELELRYCSGHPRLIIPEKRMH
jgi:hypothetical protein